MLSSPRAESPTRTRGSARRSTTNAGRRAAPQISSHDLPFDGYAPASGRRGHQHDKRIRGGGSRGQGKGAHCLLSRQDGWVSLTLEVGRRCHGVSSGPVSSTLYGAAVERVPDSGVTGCGATPSPHKPVEAGRLAHRYGVCSVHGHFGRDGLQASLADAVRSLYGRYERGESFAIEAPGYSHAVA